VGGEAIERARRCGCPKQLRPETNAATSRANPAKVLLAARAMVTADCANEVDAVNQYAEVI